MKKKYNRYSKIVLFTILSLNICFIASGQSSNQISISVGGIEYEDAGFDLLKESLQKNKKVSSLKQSFDRGTGKITLSSGSTAQELWNEIPKSTKDLFKVTTIDDNHIVLTSRNAVNQNANNETTANKKGDDCKNCYWNLCNYDVVKGFGGKQYKGINYDDGTYYYNCDNGLLIQKIIIVNGYGVTTGIQTDTLLISGGPVGTKWGVTNFDGKNEFLSAMTGADFSFAGNGAYQLIAKNISTTAGGKNYQDVIVVNYKGFSKDAFFGTSFYSTNRYYAKGVGLIRTDTLNFDSDPVAAINKKNDEKTVYSGGSVVRNGIDESIIGIWKFHNANTNKDGFYKFNGDGTFDFYEGSVTEANKYKGINRWKIEEGGYNKNGIAVIDLTWSTGNGYVLRNELQKKNDPVTKKPALLLQGAMLISADNKLPW